MVETRRARRFRVAKAAVIEQRGDKLQCIIRDISLSGASLEVSQASGVPETFNLVLPEDGLDLRCHVVWRRGFRLGVIFEEP
jgi:PilZ domain